MRPKDQDEWRQRAQAIVSVNRQVKRGSNDMGRVHDIDSGYYDPPEGYEESIPLDGYYDPPEEETMPGPIDLMCYICASEEDLYVICAGCLATHKDVEANHGSRATHSTPVYSGGSFPPDIALTTRPSNKEMARVIRALLRYADGHELRGQWAQELREIQKVAQQCIAALEAP